MKYSKGNEKPVLFSTHTNVWSPVDAFTESSPTTNPMENPLCYANGIFNFNGTTFNKDPAYDNQTSFSGHWVRAGTYQVALRVTTDQNGCPISNLPVIVDRCLLPTLPRCNFWLQYIAGQLQPTNPVPSGLILLIVNILGGWWKAGVWLSTMRSYSTDQAS